MGNRNLLKVPILVTMLLMLSLTISGCATLQYVSQEPEITEEVYSISGNTVELSLDQVPELAEVGNAVTIVDEGLPTYMVIARTGEDSYVVASSECTHRGMALSYEHDEKVFRCSSLGHSEFNLDGSPGEGFTEEPLRIYEHSIEGDLMTISFE
ncbi:MAG: ubiquinol-cytochrome c reductase iron-sulfur subunit [Methanosarcinaceae archaeon]|uniref:QcrA and Rieske domain-containing protein n=1 Tax=Methanosarcina sp. MTP4 TaxID=1434100 RepID=UPI000AE8BB27|nr:Rieske 2Fe-2S domain-containing protein [Methanosarcina sp. MTP4]